MRSKISLILFALLSGVLGNVNSQSGIDAILFSIEKNNKSLQAERQFWEAKKLEFHTGLTLPNPEFELEHFWGSPASIGGQTEVTLVQPFDFPTAYKKRRQLADEKAAQSGYAISSYRQETLLEAKLACIEIIYRQKLKNSLERRHQYLHRMERNFQEKLEVGDGNILDLNKARLQLLEVDQLSRENETALRQLSLLLRELNGGEDLIFADTLYPSVPVLPAFEELKTELEAQSVALQSLEQEKRIAEKALEVSKTLRLPKFVAGYRLQAFQGGQYNGFLAGFSLPLWEHKNQVEYQQAEVAHSASQLDAQRIEQIANLRQAYDQQAMLKIALDQYEAILLESNAIPLLDRALELGEISSTTYFLEASYYEDALLEFLKTERDYQLTLASLLKYRL